MSLKLLNSIEANGSSNSMLHSSKFVFAMNTVFAEVCYFAAMQQTRTNSTRYKLSSVQYRNKNTLQPLILAAQSKMNKNNINSSEILLCILHQVFRW